MSEIIYQKCALLEGAREFAGKKSKAFFKSCLRCGKEFKTFPCRIRIGQGNFCSYTCGNLSRRKRVERVCLTCGKTFFIRSCYLKKGVGKHCSNECKKTGAIKKCLFCGKKYYIRGAYVKRNARFCSSKCYQGHIKENGSPSKGKPCLKLRGRVRSEECKKKLSLSKIGEKNPNWKGGITPINFKIRNSRDYAIWRTAVFMRDDYTCQNCGVRNGGGKSVYLQADHIKPFSRYPELRLAIDNGRTLCRECHHQTDTYAWRMEQQKI